MTENRLGLSTYLAGGTSTNLIQTGSVDHLSVIPSGPVPPNPSELLSSGRMGKMIGELSKVYDMILIDSPPVLNVSDPLIIGKIVEGVIVVTWAGTTTYEVLRKGLKLLKDISTPLIGTVLNRFDAKKSGYYYGYGDYYYSSAKTDDEQS